MRLSNVPGDIQVAVMLGEWWWPWIMVVVISNGAYPTSYGRYFLVQFVSSWRA